ncbi:putative RNA-directed DNA polymerase [Helianthus debilis subsp. tardiflorus]
MASPSSSNTNPMFNGLAPMIAIKLTPNNYISWRTQMVPILSIQQLLSHVDGSLTPPTPTIISGEKEITNPSHTSWIRDEQQAIILLNASLSEEVFSITVGLSSAREIWVALEAAFCNASVERVENLRDNLRALKKGDKSVADFARSFKNICDQLTAIGHPIDAMDQVHWFLCGLGTSFESNFFIGQNKTNRPPFNNFQRPTCQLCNKHGHSAAQCFHLASFAQSTASPDQLAQAFHAQCQLNATVPDWTSDTGATTHMLPNASPLQNTVPMQGNQKVFFGNGQSLPITHIGNTKIFGNIALNDVLVVPSITKNLLSIGKLTEDNPIDVVFSHPYFYIQDRQTKKTLAQGCREDGLYVLRPTHEALVSISSCPQASFELWHSRLGHVNSETLFMLKNSGCVNFTSILPKPGLCSSCEIAKAKRQPFFTQ